VITGQCKRLTKIVVSVNNVVMIAEQKNKKHKKTQKNCEMMKMLH